MIATSRQFQWVRMVFRPPARPILSDVDLRLERENLEIGMERRQAPGKRVRAQCPSEVVKATLPSSPVHDVSASRSQNNAQMDLKLESLSENLSHIILLSMLEQLEDKLYNLQNTLEDIPSRVAGLMEQIWIAKSQYHPQNGGVSLEMVSPVSIRDCTVTHSPSTPQLDRPGEVSFCRQPVFADRHAPKQDCTLSSPTDVQVRPDEPRLCLQPVLSELHDPQQDQCMQPGLPDVHMLQQDQCMQPGFPDVHESQQDQCMQHGFLDVHKSHSHQCMQPEFPHVHESQQDQCVQPRFPGIHKLHPDQCMQPVLPDIHKSQQDWCKQPGFPDVHESHPDQRMQPGLPDINELQQDSIVSRCSQIDPPVRSLEEKMRLQPEFGDGQAPQQPQSIKPVFPEEKEADEHLKQEPSPLSANNWDQQQNFCLRPLFPAGDEPPPNHCKQPALPNGTEPEQVEGELMCFDCQDPQENQCLQPVSPDGKAPSEDLQSGLLSLDVFGSQQTHCLQLAFQGTQSQEQHLCLKQEFPYAQDPNVDFELESLHPNMQCPDQKYKVEPLHIAARNRALRPMRPEPQEPDQNYKLELPCTDAQGSDQNYKLEPTYTDARGSDRSYKLEPPCTDVQGLYQNDKLQPPCSDAQSSDWNSVLEPLHPESQDQQQNYKLELLCSDERGPSGPPSCLEVDASTGDQDALTDSMERGNTKSHLLLFKATSVQQSHLKSMDGEEKHKELPPCCIFPKPLLLALPILYRCSQRCLEVGPVEHLPLLRTTTIPDK
ncbi:hypothetical protein NDU88_000100 [Pleurodeles waltl]|uniref:Uncharacterized protein n=1 Tax=Pleurodeles waltl TaxID=8319 RepID=A0AAV7SVL9_PLEWA|nr:hypothetical protein NDU88_000100 [Pleurodeles waltl]